MLLPLDLVPGQTVNMFLLTNIKTVYIQFTGAMFVETTADTVVAAQQQEEARSAWIRSRFIALIGVHIQCTVLLPCR
jgi:lipoate-protein ligase B